MEETEKLPLIVCTLTLESGEAKHNGVSASLYDDILILSASGFHLELHLTALSDIQAQNYRVIIGASDGEIILSMIGHLYEDFARKLIRAYNEVLFKESLMKETAHFETDGYYTAPAEETVKAAIRICETAVAILPETHGLVRIPFCMIAQTDIQPYRFVITDRLGQSYIISKMGYSTDVFLNAYKNQIAELIRKTKDKLSEIAPVDDRLTVLLMEGMVQPLSNIREYSNHFAEALEQKIMASSIAEEFGYLKGISQDLAIGVKRGLMGDLTGETVLILTPVYDKNALIMESYGDTAAATYVFKLSKTGNADPAQWRRLLLEFNDSMLSVNFRREPIYLSDEALNDEQYEIYRNALRRVPALLHLRNLFIGRAVHNGFESWKKKVESLMQ